MGTTYNKLTKLSENIEALFVFDIVFSSWYVRKLKKENTSEHQDLAWDHDTYAFNASFFRQRYKISNLKKIIECISDCLEIEYNEYDFCKTSRSFDKDKLIPFFETYCIWKKNHSEISDKLLERKVFIDSKTMKHLPDNGKAWFLKVKKDSRSLIDVDKINVLTRSYYNTNINSGYYTSNNSWRIYNNLQLLTSNERQEIFPFDEGYYEVDLKSAHLSIFCMVTRTKKVDREKIAQESGVKLKDVKEIINLTLYGCGKAKLSEKKGFDKVSQHPDYIDLSEKSKTLQQRLYKSETLWNNRGIPKPKYKDIMKEGKQKNPAATFTHYFYTYIERDILTSMIDVVKKNRVKIVLDSHDGCTLLIPKTFSGKNSNVIFKELQSVVRDNKWEVKTDLTIKNKKEEK